MSAIAITGAGGVIGAMARRQFSAEGLAWQAISLRAGKASAPPDPACATMLHLANIARHVARNMALQRDVARLIEKSNITKVIVPQSYSTLALPGAAQTGPDRFNYGLGSAMRDPYPRGKLALEQFWMDWQGAHPHVQVIFAYIPAIIGPDSNWSAMIRAIKPGKILLVPRIARFHMVRQHDLIAAFSAMHRAPLAPGISRRLMATDCMSLKQAVAHDWPGDIMEVALPYPARLLCRIAERLPLADKALLALLKIARKVVPLVSGITLPGLSPKYLQLFLRQSELGAEISLLERGEEKHSIGFPPASRSNR